VLCISSDGGEASSSEHVNGFSRSNSISDVRGERDREEGEREREWIGFKRRREERLLLHFTSLSIALFLLSEECGFRLT
jgi:hypothetical protein